MWRLLKHNLGEGLAALAWEPVDRGRGVFFNRFRNLVTDAIAANDTALLPKGETWQKALSAALDEGVDVLTNKLGRNIEGWAWKQVHSTRPQHPLSMAASSLSPVLDPPRISTGGDGDTPWAGAYAPADFATVGGMSVFRYAYDPTNWERSLWAVPLGSSGHPGSPHFADQAEMWGQVRMAPMTYGWDRVAARAESEQTLHPA